MDWASVACYGLKGPIDRTELVVIEMDIIKRDPSIKGDAA